MCKPVIKWVGGKRQLLNKIKEEMPKKYNRYHEPFIGGGALFFDLSPKNAVINDFNEELINMYQVLKENPKELMIDLCSHLNTEEYYYSLRKLDRLPIFKKISKLKRASRFIFLNKTGFNGLYRVNKKGQNNVPYGRYKNPKIFEENNFINCSKVLKNTTILTGDFENIKPYIKKGDFIYLDPPYVPLNKTSNFTSYTEKGFDLKMQYRLKDFCDYIDSIGAYFIQSNSHTDFVLNLYQEYNIINVEANRALNCNGEKRGKILEVLIKNF